MKLKENLKLVAIATVAVVGLTACDKQPGPAESAGQSIGRAADDAGRNISAASDNVASRLEEQGAKSGVAMSDTEITARIKAAIFAEPGLQTLQISVDTVAGVVSLSGSVDTLSSSEKAAALARAVEGVESVNNQLVATASPMANQ